MSYKDTMKLGFVSMAYPPPAEITDRVEALKWHMSKTQEFGGGVTQAFLMEPTQVVLEDIKEHMVKTNMELELGASVFSFRDDDNRSVSERLRPSIEAAKFLGVKILRGAYGRLRIEYSRFNKNRPVKEHMQFLIDNLKEAAKIIEDAGMYYALENHCDFTGKEFAEIFSAVNSKHIGCTLDTANGFTVFCDPNEDVEYLAEFAITTHLKDMLVQDCKTAQGLPMFQARGCALGDGHVDIPRAIELLDQKSPMRDGLHLVIEQGWMNYDGVEDTKAYDRECLEKGWAYLKKVMGRN